MRTAPTGVGARLRRALLLTGLLILLGTGTAAAVWTAQGSATAAATAATPGLEMTLQPAADGTTLEVTYDQDTTTAAGVVALRSTGSREGTLTADVAATVAGAPADALQVQITPVTAAEECAPTSGPDGTGGADGTVRFSGLLGAQETQLLCVRTALPAADHRTHSGEPIELTVTATLAYAENAPWRVTTARTVLQQVDVPAPLAEVPGLRFTASGSHLTVTWGAPAGAQHRYVLVAEQNPQQEFPFRAGQTHTEPAIEFHHSTDQTELRQVMDSVAGNEAAVRLIIEQSTGDGEPWTRLGYVPLILDTHTHGRHVTVNPGPTGGGAA